VVVLTGAEGFAGVPSTSAPVRSTEPNRTPASQIAQTDRLAATGRYEEAAKRYEQIAEREPAQRLAAMIGLASVFEQTGHYQDGLARLEAVRSEGQKDARWQIARGRLLEAVGHYDQAVQAYQAAMAVDADAYEARYRLAHLHEITGQRDRAVRLYAFFDELAHQRVPERPEELLWHGLGFYRYTVLTTHAELPRRTRYVLHELLQPVYEVKDPQNWAARVAAGELLLEKYNVRDAAEDFEAALAIHPHLPAAEVGLASIALEAWQFEECQAHLRQALTVNPNYVPALNALAELRMTERRYREALAEVERALRVNPNDLKALSLAAAAHVRLGDESTARSYEERVGKINPCCALLHGTIAEWLSAGRQFAQAEKRYLRAIELDPTWADPQTNLGLMYMQWGEETKARAILDRAWQLDRFNAKTFNVRRLLEQLEGFQRIESEHFVVKLDATQDAVLGPYFVEYLESIRPELCREYGHTPSGKIIVEVFPTHGAFSVRITSRPWIHTIGACTGRVIALDAPRTGASLTGPYDWARVLRHELTHAVTLGATGNRIPHWLTEGLAVRHENVPRSFRWMEMLSETLRRGRLIALEDLDWAFIRPRRVNERELAYAQSEWMVEFLVAEHGVQAITKLLDLIGQGRAQSDGIREVCGVSLDEFDRRFRRWATDQVRTWGLPVEPIPPVEQLKAAAAGQPTDPTALAALAEALLYDGQIKQADDLARQALTLDPDHPGALTVRCTVLMEAWQHARKTTRQREEVADQAEPLLRKLARSDAQSRVAPRYLALLAMDRRDVDEARTWLERLRKISPHDPVAHQGLAACHLQQGRYAEAIAELTALAADNEHDRELPIRIADLCMELDRQEEAARWLLKAVHIDPYHVETHEQLGELSLKLGRIDQAIREYEALTALEPAKADHFARLASCYKKKGQRDRAQAAAKRAVDLDADSPAKAILDEGH